MKTPDRYLGGALYSSYESDAEYLLQNCVIGTNCIYYLDAFEFSSHLRIYSDRPEMVQLSQPNIERDSMSPKNHYSGTIKLVGTGDACMTVTMDGTVLERWSVHAFGGLHPSYYPHLQFSQRLIHTNEGHGAADAVRGQARASISLTESLHSEERNVTELWYHITSLQPGVRTISCCFQDTLVF